MDKRTATEQRLHHRAPLSGRGETVTRERTAIDAASLASHNERIMQSPWQRSRLRWPITLSAALIVLNVTLMVCWIVLFVRMNSPGALTMGVIAFALILIGLSFWLFLTIKEIQLNHRQANFVDSVTHELKSPIAALQLYLETLQMRSIDDAKREEFHAVMEKELHRLDQLINQLLEVGRLDAIGEQDGMEDVELGPIVDRCVQTVCAHHDCDRSVFTIDVQPTVVQARRLVVETIFSNLIDNAVKYAGSPTQVTIVVGPYGTGRIRAQFANNGPGVPPEDRKKVFRIFYRGGSELKRKQKGTGLGLFIVSTLVKKLHGKVAVWDRPDGGEGCVFVLDLPGHLIERPEGRAADLSQGDGSEQRTAAANSQAAVKEAS